jgi:hypothetical protein
VHADASLPNYLASDRSAAHISAMSNLMPCDEFPPGLDHGDFVPLTVMECRTAYLLFQDGLDGLLLKDPGFPAFIQDATTGEPKAFEDTPFNRAWHAVGKHFDDIAKRISFQYRVLHLMPMISKDRKYGKYLVNKKPHIALLAAMASVPFDREFRQRLASTVNADQDSDDATRQ